ncbi:hypothetical protein A6R68_08421 [Neotoma lepida]|uniref:C2H2-type domain-containing protein n=1 Tax=Neotoma lepida TaxID=56216 RepID=A0A1A6G3N4_NEOLE|nr:hypothetical protein A6R68_08421 [Neotoma lepida]
MSAVGAVVLVDIQAELVGWAIQALSSYPCSIYSFCQWMNRASIPSSFWCSFACGKVCVVGGCNASFASQGGLARHVPTHFSQQNSSKVSSQPKAKEESPSKAGMNKRRKLKNKRRRSLPRPHDFFDAQTLDAIRHRAICFNLSAHIESLGKGHSVVFHSTCSLPDVWVNESERHQLKTKVVHLSKLPKDTALLLDPNIYRTMPQKRLKR